MNLFQRSVILTFFSVLPCIQFERYSQQSRIVTEIVMVFDTDPDNFDRVVDLMQRMQEFGQPPAEIVKAIAPEGAEGDAAAVRDDACCNVCLSVCAFCAV